MSGFEKMVWSYFTPLFYFFEKILTIFKERL